MTGRGIDQALPYSCDPVLFESDVRDARVYVALTERENGPIPQPASCMHPKNISCIGAAGVDCCSLANNHVPDWGYAGLAETIERLHRVGIKTIGADSVLGPYSRGQRSLIGPSLAAR